MESISKEKLQELADFHGVNCVSIYIPTHRYGKEVNEGEDARLLKNHYQKVKNHLESKNIHEQEVKKYLEPIRELVDDGNFWRHQEEGLAIFLGDGFFQYYKLPYTVAEGCFTGTSFHPEQLLAWFNKTDVFYILALSLKKVRLFMADSYSARELNIAEKVPADIDSVLSYYEFQDTLQHRSGGGIAGANFHGQGGDKGDGQYDDAYIEEYFRHMNESLEQVITRKDLPIVVAAVDYLHPIYQHTAKGLNLQKEGVKGNPDELRADELYDKAMELMQPHLDKDKFDGMEKYRANAGTGKASHDIRDVALAALEGRVDTLFVAKGAHAWGFIDPQNNNVQLHEERHENDQCLVSKTAVQTVLHGGNTYFVDKESLPETFAEADMAAVFRW